MDTNTTTFSDLDEAEVSVVRAAFAGLARAQRGEPERMAVSLRSNPGLFNATGAFTFLAEHVGDLTHRLCEDGGDWTSFGFATVSEKVGRGLRYSRNGYGLAREVETNLRNNHACRVEDGRTDLPIAAFREEFVAAAARYARAHAELVVWNEAQWHARESAIALGEMRFDDMFIHLEVIEGHLLEGRDEWRTWAGQASIEDGVLVVFEGARPQAMSPPGLR